MITAADRESRVRDAATAISWLESHPDDYAAILVCARLEADPQAVCFDGTSAVDAESVEQRKRLIERYFTACFFGACPLCFLPIVTFTDARAVDWPALTRHACEQGWADAEVDRIISLPQRQQQKPKGRAL